MPFIGTQPEVGGYSVLDALTASATASYTLQLNSANFVPASANQLLVSLNGVIQKPGSSFTVSGSTLTFSSALASSDSIDFIISMGEPLLVGVPSDSTITGSKLASNIAISTSGNIATTGSGTLSVAGTSTLTGNTTVSGTAAITGNTTVGGTLTSTGKITSTAGITFGSDTAAANVLDDYEEGTFTATSDNSVTFHSYQNLLGYTKIGREVTIRGQLRISSSGSGAVVVNNLPFASQTGSQVSQYSFGAVRLYEWNMPSDSKYAGAYVGGGDSRLHFTNVRDNQATDPLIEDQDAYVMLNITYPTAS